MLLMFSKYDNLRHPLRSGDGSAAPEQLSAADTAGHVVVAQLTLMKLIS